LENNPSLHGRPKLLFFDLCRGDILNKGKTWGRTKSKKQDINKIPCGTDFFVGFATTPGIFIIIIEKKVYTNYTVSIESLLVHMT